MLSKSEIKYIQSLSQKKFRGAENCYVVEGPKIVAEALMAKQVQVKRIYALAEWRAAAVTAGVPIIEVEPHELQKISQLTTPNQVLAIVQKPEERIAEAVDHTFIVALDGIQDPGNMGTIIRTADWFGITQIVCSPDCADVFGSKVVQATMGSIFRVHIYYADLPLWLKGQAGAKIFGAALEGTPLKNIREISGGIIVIGNESKGITPAVMDCITQRITIERVGQAESLNAAVAAGIIISHLVQ